MAKYGHSENQIHKEDIMISSIHITGQAPENYE